MEFLLQFLPIIIYFLLIIIIVVGIVLGIKLIITIDKVVKIVDLIINESNKNFILYTQKNKSHYCDLFENCFLNWEGVIPFCFLNSLIKYVVSGMPHSKAIVWICLFVLFNK